MPRYPEYQIHSLDTHGYGRVIQTIDGKFYDGWGNTVIFTLFGKEVSINVEGVGEDSTDGGNVNVTNTNNTDLFQDLQIQINNLKNQLTEQNKQLSGASASYVLPGTIVMWGGSVNGIPSSWSLCDGKALLPKSKLRDQLIDQDYPFGRTDYIVDDGGVEFNAPFVPDLRERFVVGAGGNNTTVSGNGYIVGEKDGLINNMLTLKNIPEHEHRFSTSKEVKSIIYENINNGSFTNKQVVNTLTFTEGTWKTTAFNLGPNAGIWSAGPNPKKDGPGFTQSTSGSTTSDYPNNPDKIENRPPYFALCYIIKL